MLCSGCRRWSKFTQLDGIPNDDEVIAEATLLPPAIAAAITISLAALIPTKTTCGTGYHSAMPHAPQR
jgi:hypothetical protein